MHFFRFHFSSLSLLSLLLLSPSHHPSDPPLDLVRHLISKTRSPSRPVLIIGEEEGREGEDH